MTDDQMTVALIDLKRIANALDAIERHLDERLGKPPVSSKGPPSSGKGRGK